MLKVIKSIKHQEIGGKEFIPEFEITASQIEKEVFSGNIACFNFVMRREDFDETFDKRCFYGKVGMFGYVVCIDELDGDLSELDNLKNQD